MAQRYRFSTDPEELFEGFALPMAIDLYAFCAALGALALLLPHPAEVRVRAGWALVGLTLLGTLVMYLGRHRVPHSVENWMAAPTIVVILAAVWAGGPGTGAVALASFFNFIAAIVFAFLPSRWIATYLLAIGVGYGAILGFQHVDGWPALLVILMGELIGVAAVTHQLASRLNELAMQDELTLVDNRRAWYARVTEEMARARRRGSSFSIVLIDLDGFKAVNDAGGHEAGDRLLIEITEAWAGQLREVDGLARWGGDEFALVLPDCREDEARQTVDRLRAVMPGEHTFSAGVAAWGEGETPDDLVRRADTAVYQVKRERG